VQLHHLFYPTPITATEPKHLMPLCWKCHKAAHAAKVRAYVRDESAIEAKRRELISRLSKYANPGDTFLTTEQNQKRIEELKRRAAQFRPQPSPNRVARKKENPRHVRKMRKLAHKLSRREQFEVGSDFVRYVAMP